MSARSLNKVMIIGNLTRDPNLRYTPSGTAVCSFGLATNRTWTPSEGGEKQEKVEYHNIVAWSKLADICGQLLHKGDKVYVEGRLQSRDWKGDDGQDRRITEIVIDNMILLRSSQGGAGGSYSNDNYGDEAGGYDEGSSAAPAASAKKSKKSSKTDDFASEEGQSAEDVADDVPF
jgi:single-strand DNA-binding protein